MSTVGDNILRMRKELGWTQEELAKRMGYKSKSTINKIELGINDIPQSKIVKFAEELGTTPAHLMGWTENPKWKESETPDKLQLTEGEKTLLELFRLVPEKNRAMVLEMIRAAVNTHI